MKETDGKKIEGLASGTGWVPGFGVLQFYLKERPPCGPELVNSASTCVQAVAVLCSAAPGWN